MKLLQNYRVAYSFILSLALLVSSEGKLGAMTASLSLKHFEQVNSKSSDGISSDVMTIRLQKKREKRKFTSAVDGSLRLFPSDSVYSISLSEAYFQINGASKKSSLTIGRQLKSWNPAAKFWGVDSVDGMRDFELMDDKQEGLLGVHYDRSVTKNFKVSLLFSYLYLPKLNGTTAVKDGAVKGISDIDTKQYESTVIMGKSVPLYYSLNRPEISDVIFQKTLGGNATYKVGNFSINGYGIYKPESKFRFNAIGYLEEDLNRVAVNIKPFINYQLVYGGFVSGEFAKLKSSAGFEVINPDDNFIKNINNFDPIHISPNEKTILTDYERVSPSYQRQTYLYLSSIYQGFVSVGGNYMRLLKLDAGSEDSKVFNNIMWENAVGVFFNYSFLKKWNFYFKEQYDLSRRDNLLKAEVGYSFNSFYAKLGLKMLKVPSSESYWNDYKTHDSLYSEISYTY